MNGIEGSTIVDGVVVGVLVDGVVWEGTGAPLAGVTGAGPEAVASALDVGSDGGFDPAGAVVAEDGDATALFDVEPVDGSGGGADVIGESTIATSVVWLLAAVCCSVASTHHRRQPICICQMT